jgi:hypothetical protein
MKEIAEHKCENIVDGYFLNGYYHFYCEDCKEHFKTKAETIPYKPEQTFKEFVS